MRPMRGILLKIASVVVFIGMFSLIKYTAPRIPPGEAVFFRSFFAMPVIVIWLWWRHELAVGLRTANPLGHVWRGVAGTMGMGLGFAALAFASFMATVVVALPPAPFWPYQAAYEVAFGNAWRVVAASMVAYFCGEFVNSFVLAKMKVAQGGRHLWKRTIGSTIAGEAVDSALFYPLAFYGTGIIPNEALPMVMVAQFFTKTMVEVVVTPVTYKVVAFLKQAEGEDYYDRTTDFNPFKLET